MPKATGRGTHTPDAYWKRRFRSKEFANNLRLLLIEEFTRLAGTKIKDVLEARIVRRIIEEWDDETINHTVVADLAIQGIARVAENLSKKNTSLLGLLDEDLIAAVQRLLEETGLPSKHAQHFVEKLMQQEFVHNLFTDIVYTSIVAFYEKVNPFFGGFTMKVLEDRVKGFIRIFMPVIQKQATAFAMNKRNQPIVSEFTRAIVNQLLAEPMPHYFAMISSGQKKKAAALIQTSVGSATLGALLRELALAAWDDFYERHKDARVGDLVRLEEHASRLAERSTDLILRALSHPPILRFIAGEVALVGGHRR